MSLRHSSEGVSIGSWLEARGLHEPRPRGEGGPTKALRRPLRKVNREDPFAAWDLLGSIGGGRQLDQDQDYAWLGNTAIMGDGMGYEAAGLDAPLNIAAADNIVERHDSGVQPQQPQEPQRLQGDGPVEVRVTCRGLPGVLDLITWKASVGGQVWE